MAGISDDGLASVGPWPAGINNIAKEGALPRDQNGRTIALREADNVDLSAEGVPSRRDGYTLAVSLELGHSAWSHELLDLGLFVTAGSLHVLHATGEVTDLGVAVGNLPVSFTLLGDRVYFCNRNVSGMLTLDLQAHAWAPEAPAGQPVVSAVDGFGLPAGYYQVAITYTDTLGRESSSALAAPVDVAENGGIELAGIPQPADGAATPLINLYLTGQNDQVLKLSRTITVGTTYAVLSQPAAGRTLPAGLQLLRPLPPGAITRGANGRQYVADGQEVFWSPALRYGMYDRVANRLRFSAAVTMVEPVGSASAAGIYVAAGNRTYWLSGPDPAAFDQRIAYGHGVVPGTSTIIGGDVLGLDGSNPVAVWIATNGQFCAGLPGGQVVPVKNGQAVVDAAERGAILLREQDGIRQLIATLTATRPQGLAVSDRVVTKLIKAS